MYYCWRVPLPLPVCVPVPDCMNISWVIKMYGSNAFLYVIAMSTAISNFALLFKDKLPCTPEAIVFSDSSFNTRQHFSAVKILSLTNNKLLCILKVKQPLLP